MVKLHPHPGRHLFAYAIIILALAIILAGGLIAWGFYSARALSSGSTITITATGSASTTGGMTELYLYANGTGNTTQQAIANLSTTLTSVNNTLSKYLNGNLSLISTEYFNAGKVTQCVPYPYVTLPAWCTGHYNRTAYQAYESIIVDIPNAQNATGALISLSAIPNVYISNLQTKLSPQQISTLRSEALTTAMANATSQAEAVSPTGKASVINITVNNYSFYPLPYSFGGTVPVETAATSQVVNSIFYGGTSSVTESVTVMFRTG